MNHDVIVIGGGPAGVTAALRARELGASVALVERQRMGGTCTNDGCVPTRVLAHAARLVREADQFADYGLDVQLPTVDFSRLLAKTQRVVYGIHEKKQLINTMQDAGVSVYLGVGQARFIDPQTISLGNGSQLQARKFIICAGGHARRHHRQSGTHAARDHPSHTCCDGKTDLFLGGAFLHIQQILVKTVSHFI